MSLCGDTAGDMNERGIVAANVKKGCGTRQRYCLFHEWMLQQSDRRILVYEMDVDTLAGWGNHIQVNSPETIVPTHQHLL